MKLIYKVQDNNFFNVKEVLKSYFEISDRLLVKLKKNKQIFLNSKPVYVTQTININDVLEVNLDSIENSDNILPIKMPLDIIFEDDSFLIINKPSGIPVHPSMAHFSNSLSNGVKYYFVSNNIPKKVRPINRLDKNTSGIVLFAKNEYVQEALVKQMKNKVFKKEYIAILEGHLEQSFGTINAPISRKQNSIIEREVNPSGDASITHFEVLKKLFIDSTKISLVKFNLETGRTHQLRVHSKYIGNPILGDSLYGNESNFIKRQALHAFKVTFIHPITKKIITLEIDLPEDIKNILNNSQKDYIK